MSGDDDDDDDDGEGGGVGDDDDDGDDDDGDEYDGDVGDDGDDGNDGDDGDGHDDDHDNKISILRQQVSAKPKEYASWITGGSAKTNPQWYKSTTLQLYHPPKQIHNGINKTNP